MSCGCETKVAKTSNSADTTLKVDFLFLDESVCAPCGGTSKALTDAIDMLAQPLKSMGIDLQVEKIHVVDQDVAVAEKFLSSPTIRVKGKDIDPARTEDDCPTCGTLAGDATSVSCRNWHWRGKVYQAAPVGKIVEAIMDAALPSSKSAADCCREAEDDEVYMLPENLKGFFAARARNEQLGC